MLQNHTALPVWTLSGWFSPMCEGYINKTVKKVVSWILKAVSHRDAWKLMLFRAPTTVYVIVNIVLRAGPRCGFFVSFFCINILIVIVQTHLWSVVENCRQINGKANAQNCTWQRSEMSGSSFWMPLSAAAWPSYQGFLHQLSGKVGQMLKFKEAPAGVWGAQRQKGQASTFSYTWPVLEPVLPHSEQKKWMFWSSTLIYIYTWKTDSQQAFWEKKTTPFPLQSL